MPTYEVDVEGNTYEVDAPSPQVAWQYATFAHTQKAKPAPAKAPSPPEAQIFTDPMTGLAMGQAPVMIAPKTPILEQKAAQPPAPATSDELLGVNPQYIKQLKAQLDAMEPQLRQGVIQQMGQTDDVFGRTIRQIGEQYKNLDLLGQKSPQLQKIADNRLEVQANRYMEQGAAPETAISMARARALTGQVGRDAQVLTRDIAGEQAAAEAAQVKEEMEGAGFTSRVGAEMRNRAEKTGMGLLNMYADLTGDEEMQANLRGALRVGTERGKAIPKGEGVFMQAAQQAIASAGGQAPMMLASALTGSAVPVLVQAGLDSFGSSYAESREAGKSPDQAFERASLMAAAEVFFERFGMTKALSNFRAFREENPTASIPKYFAKAIGAEIPTELLTTTAQDLTDMVPGIGLKPNLTWDQYLEDLADTLRQTVIQAGAVAGTSVGVIKGARAISNRMGIEAPPSRVPYERPEGGEDLARRMLEERFGRAEAPIAPPVAAPVAPPVAEAPPPVRPTVPEEAVVPGITREEEFAGLAPRQPSPVETPEAAAPRVEEAPVEPPAAPPPAKFEPKIINRFQAPDGMEVHVFTTTEGYGTGLFDAEAGQYVNGSITRFKGEDTLPKAQERAADMVAKATPVETVAPPVAPPVVETKVEAPVEPPPMPKARAPKVEAPKVEAPAEVPKAGMPEVFAQLDPETRTKFESLYNLAQLYDHRVAGDQMPDWNRAVKGYQGLLEQKGKEEADKLFPTTEKNIRDQGGQRVYENAARMYSQQFGTPAFPTPSVLKAAVKSGAFDISGQPWAAAYYDSENIKPEKIAPKAAPVSDAVSEHVARFNAGHYRISTSTNIKGKTVKTAEESYAPAVKQFLEGPLTAKPPTGKQDGLDVTVLNTLTDIDPQPVELKGKPGTAKDFLGYVKALQGITPKQDVRYYLKGVLLDPKGDRIASTDGHRMAIVNRIGASSKVPERPTNVSSTSSIFVGADGKWAKIGENPIDGKFPDIDRVIPKPETHTEPVSFNTDQFLAKARAIEKANKYFKTTYPVALPIQIGDTMHGFNPQYVADMADVFRKMGYDKFNLSLPKGKSGALLATSPDGKVQQVVMPMRIGNDDGKVGPTTFKPISSGEAPVKAQPPKPKAKKVVVEKPAVEQQKQRKPIKEQPVEEAKPEVKPEAKPEVTEEAKPTTTKEQREEAETHASEVGGEVAWQKGDVALVRGYSMLSGDPVYVPTKGSSRAKVDIERFTGSVFTDEQKQEMIEAKRRLEKEAERKHAETPFIVFDKGISLSKDIPADLAGVIREWKDLLKLDANVYVSTIEDAKANRNNFTGPHRRVGSGTLDEFERGSMRRMADGSYYVLFDKSTSRTRMLEVIAHEMGHLHQRLYYDNATPEEKKALQDAHAKWLEKQKGKTAQELLYALRARTTARTTIAPKEKMADELSSYWRSFGEWYADQTARWATSSAVPVSIVEKFFKRLGHQLNRFYRVLKNAKYLPDETFAQYIDKATKRPVIVEAAVKDAQQDRAEKMSNQDVFGFDDEDTSGMVSKANPVVAKALNEASELPGVKKKLPPGRSPELAAAANQLANGTLTAAEYDKLVNKYRPIAVYAEPMKLATAEQVFDALDSSKRQQINPQISAGTEVGLRLDIPAFNRKGVFVVSIHQKRTPSSVGKVIGYGSAASIKDVSFGIGNQKAALKIAQGEAKDALQTMEGKYVPMTPEQVYARAQEAFKDPTWVQVGIDPTRHAYFYDRRTTMPVVKADEVLQVGNMILAKGVTYGDKENFVYNIDITPGFSKIQLAKRSKEDRQEVIKEYTKLRADKARLMEKVKEGEADLSLQQKLTILDKQTKQLKDAIEASRQRRDSPEQFLAKALKEYDNGNLDADVLAVIQAAYNKQPWLLNGLLLSVRAPVEGRAAGAFDALNRVIRLYKGTSGAENPGTIRHELAHTLEQMMDEKQRKVVIEAWGKSLAKAIEQNSDAKYQEYFNRVLDFIDNPSERSYRRAVEALPSYDMYQYISPSEYWAVNAEPLMGQQLGAYWERFKKSVRALFEGLKNVFGFDNKYAIHQVFNQVMTGPKERITTDMLQDMVKSVPTSFTTLENIQDDQDLIKKYNRPKTPMMDTSPVKTFIVNKTKLGAEMFKEAVLHPLDALNTLFTGVERGVVYTRNKNIWFGSGLNAADFSRYAGSVRTAQDIATGSLALDTAIRSGQIGTEVVFMGGLAYNPKTLTFNAVERKYGMKGVYKAEKALRDKLGDQLATDVIQGYLEAKRSRSIENEYLNREAEVESLALDLAALRKNPQTTQVQLDTAIEELEDARRDLEAIKVARSKINMSEEEIDEFIARDKEHPELKDIMTNWTAVNQNLLKIWKDVGLLSQQRYDNLSSIKDYVPWNRIMSDDKDIHSPVQSTTRSMTNIGKEKLFKVGKPSVITTFEAEDGQQVFQIQPSAVVTVSINDKVVPDTDIETTPDGDVKINVPIKKGDIVIFRTNREIENIIDNMTRNVMRMTMNALRQYAANRIVHEYGTRNSKGQLLAFSRADRDNGRFNYIVNGRKINVEIRDPLVAEAVLGMESIGLEAFKIAGAVANMTRRLITLSGAFQVEQVFKDAPTAALVTGVKNPAALLGGVYKGFVTSLMQPVAKQVGISVEPAYDILRASGIGGHHSPARTPEAEIKRRLGIMNRSAYSFVIKGLDHIGDASDMAQRVATYNRILKETGDEALALYQAANVINFHRHGSGQVAQAIVKTVPFINSYAQSIDSLYQALLGSGLKGLSRAQALRRLAVTGSLLAATTIIYCMLVGGDDDYDKMDDQEKLRNYIIPGTKIRLPMNTSAAYFFKAIPELIYNKITREGTKNELDNKRVRTALQEAAVDMLLGPTMIPAGGKQIVEIALNHNFFTGREVVPARLKDVDAAEQYTAATSELGKRLSALTGTDEKRVLNPIEMDHLVRGLFGSAGAMAQWASNVMGDAAKTRPEEAAKKTPILGRFLRTEVPRGAEDLFYDLKEDVDKKYNTFKKLIDREKYDEADRYLEKHEKLLATHDYIQEAGKALAEINKMIKYYGETTDTSITPAERRKEIESLQREKQDMLENIAEIRKEAGL